MNWTEVVITIVSLLITGLLIPVVKSRLSEKQQNTLDYWVRYLIAAAEIEIDGEKMGKKKQEFVIAKLKAMGLVTEKNEQNVRDLITGICQELTAAFVINRDMFAPVSLGQIEDTKGDC